MCWRRESAARCDVRGNKMDEESLDYQASVAITALAAALCKQPGIDGDQLRLDFLEILEGIARSPDKVNTVGIDTARLMDILLRAAPRKP